MRRKICSTSSLLGKRVGRAWSPAGQRPTVAQELGITTNAVYLAKSRVLRRLHQELSGLLD
jgi:hypothetical protein